MNELAKFGNGLESENILKNIDMIFTLTNGWNEVIPWFTEVEYSTISTLKW